MKSRKKRNVAELECDNCGKKMSEFYGLIDDAEDTTVYCHGCSKQLAFRVLLALSFMLDELRTAVLDSEDEETMVIQFSINAEKMLKGLRWADGWRKGMPVNPSPSKIN